MLDRFVVCALLVVLATPSAAFAGPKENAERLGAQLDLLEANIPPERYDAAALLASLGDGIEPAFAFVRDRIGFDAYPGVLRGARGTLVHGAGNALDRALLLAALLGEKGVRTRFVTARLDAAACERLLGRLFARTAAPTGGVASESDFARRVKARGERDAAAVRKTVGPSFAKAAPSTRAEALETLAAHAWVQALDGERWIDLDPSFPDATPGRAYGTPGTAPLEALPQDLHQTLTIRVLAETLSGGTLATQKALEYEAYVADLRDAQVYLLHAPPRPSGLAGAIDAATAGPEAWSPALWVDGEAFGGQPVSFVDAPKERERGRPPSGGLGGMLGGGGALGSSRVLVAEWLEIEVRAPGRAPEIVRRALVNRASAAWREGPRKDAAGLAPLARIGGKPCAVQEVHNLWVTAGRHDLGAFAQAIRLWGAPEAPAAERPEGDTGFVERVWAFTLQNALLAIFTDEVFLPALDRSEAVRFCVDGPRVTLVTTGPALQAGAEGSRFRVDLVHDRIGGVARTDADEEAVVAGKILYGATQGALEHETCARLAHALGLPAEHVGSTSAIRGETALVAAGSGGLPTFRDADVAARVAVEARDPGVVLAVPEAALGGGIAAWWRVRADGTTSAVYEEGNAGGLFGKLPPGPPIPPAPIGKPHVGPPRPVVRPTPPRPPGPRMPPGGGRLWPPPPDIGPFDRLHDPWSPDPKKRNRTAGQEYLMVLTWIAMEAAFAVGMGVLLSYMPGVQDLARDLIGSLSDALR